MKRLVFFVLLLSSMLTPVAAQNMHFQWASKIVWPSQNTNSVTNTIVNTLGSPDAWPLGIDHKDAWQVNLKDVNPAIRVGFNKAQAIRQVIVLENFNAGAIKNISLLDTLGKRYPVYSKADLALLPYRILTIQFPLTTYLVKEVEVEFFNTANRPAPQVDAIGISASSDPFRAVSFIKKTGRVLDKDVLARPKRQNLGTGVNSPYVELNPVIAPDGQTLYFARQKHPDNTKRKADPQDIWYSQLDTLGNWQTAERLLAPLNDPYPNGVCSVSPDGNTLVLLNQYQKDGPPLPGVSISHRTRKGWSQPTALKIENFKSQSDYATFYMGTDNKTLLMGIDAGKGLGGEDLHVSFLKPDGTWTAPLNLGSSINTASADYAPFLAGDGKTLYFASEGHSGIGGSDIYVSKRLDDSWTRWSTPRNLGKDINTTGNDSYYTLSAAGNYAYLVSDIDGMNRSRDIFSIKLPDTLRPEPVLLVRGKVYNAKTFTPLEASLLYEKSETGQEMGTARTSPEDGSYKVVLPSGHDYHFRAEAKGYIDLTQYMPVADLKEYKEIQQDLYMLPIEVGQVIPLPNIVFHQSKYELLDASMPELNRLAKLMQNNPSLEIELGGHTDNFGSFSANKKLSENRVIVVKEYLVSKGIKAKRITTQAYGSTRPLASNEEEATRRLNRRVEFTVTNY
jgi:outer membrane protein OmpA-like peptidoglycan-associated protein